MNEIPYVSHHAQSRAAERYGIPATPAIWADAVLRILDAVEGKPRALLLRRYNSGIELWLVKLGGVDVRMVWSPATGCVVTVLERAQGTPGRA